MKDLIEIKKLISQVLESTNVAFIDRPLVIGAAAAVVISRHISVPVEEVENLRMHLLATELPELERAISVVNEVTIINTTHTKELAMALWKIRYYAAHPLCLCKTSLRYGFIDSLVNTDECVSGKDHEFLNKYKQAIALLTPHVYDIIMR